MPARPFWILFTLCIITLVEWLAVKPITEMRIADDIEALKIPYSAVFDLDEKNPDRLIEKSDLHGKSFKTKWEILYSRDPSRLLIMTAALFVMGILAGFLVASVAFRHLVKFGDRLGKMNATDKVALLSGSIMGVLISALLLPSILQYLPGSRPILAVLGLALIVYGTVWAVMSMKDELKYYFPGLAKDTAASDRDFEKPKLLDTNVIIDGRIADVCRTGFVEGQIFVPSFVLEELQHIADSSDSLRRARGRRGLDILNQMRKEQLDLAIRQSDPVDAANAEEVDIRLVHLAKEIDACIVTNDFNLNKVAELHGVTVLNINELANALKPVVLPGEEMNVNIIKEGKEINQGVAYLDDGTMIVVEGARKHVGETVDAVVTSVLQTVAGKMIFANMKEAQEEQDDLIGRNVRNYSSFRPGKKTR